MNDALTVRLDGIREILMAHHKASSRLPNAAKGDERETLIREFLEKVFPLPFRFGCGAMADSYGNCSGQSDIVVEFPFFASFPAPAGGQRLYLAESVAFTIEVKSNLSKQWSQVEETVEKIRPLRRRWRGHVNYDPASGIAVQPASNSRIPVIAVGFEGDQTPENLSKRLANTPEERRPDAAFVIESGAFAEGGNLAVAAKGLFQFCATASHFARNVLAAEPDLLAYVGGDLVDVG